MARASPRTTRFGVPNPIRLALAATPAATAVPDGKGDADAQPASVPVPQLKAVQDEDKRVIQSIGEQMSFGGVLGFATGYSIRKVGKAVLFLIGTEVVILQYMAYRRWLTMDWNRLGQDLAPRFSKSAWEGLMEILVYKMPFSAAFSGGLVAGLRLSTAK